MFDPVGRPNRISAAAHCLAQSTNDAHNETRREAQAREFGRQYLPHAPVHRYDPRTGILRLGLEGNGSAGLRVTTRAQMAQRADFDFSPTVPLILEANLGASDATLDLGGMTILSLTVRGGASRSAVTFATPNQGECTRADFTLGAA